MSATSRPVDLVRDTIRTNVLPSYSPAIMWDESEQPFQNSESNIILARQEGRTVDAFIRVHDVQVWLFSKAGADIGDANTLFNDANLACDYIMSVNLILSTADEGKAPLVIEHVTGPYRTAENRYFYRFTVRVLS